MKQSKVLKLALIFIVPLIMIGCATARQKPIVYSQVVGLDKNLMKITKIENVRARYLDSGSLEASMLILNLAQEDLSIRVKFKFLDEDGFPLEETSWMPYVLTRGEDTLIKENSISFLARDFKVLIDWQ